MCEDDDTVVEYNSYKITLSAKDDGDDDIVITFKAKNVREAVKLALAYCNEDHIKDREYIPVCIE